MRPFEAGTRVPDGFADRSDGRTGPGFLDTATPPRRPRVARDGTTGQPSRPFGDVWRSVKAASPGSPRG
ncbi:hypothetical protein K933_09087 [Candidatus Halobonum tyrrellensis G22]|uniref:Uncharacterized protein n=1 Tax=Candidatus Halobonum tyrrellensis G22 TaxID=1324957 RepID=V4HES2_9EURY|nr:hypothetical protein K933_09087 [Candidatus Halobonum tyrrellensis G22]